MSFQVINHAVLSEKAYKQMEKGIYTFHVDKRAAKDEIAKAVESQFGVKVKKVNIAKKSAKEKRISKSRKTVLVGGGKKAIVTLGAGQSIAMLSPKTEKASKATKVSKGKESDEKSKGKGLLSRIRKPDKTEANKSEIKSKKEEK